MKSLLALAGGLLLAGLVMVSLPARADDAICFAPGFGLTTNCPSALANAGSARFAPNGPARGLAPVAPPSKPGDGDHHHGDHHHGDHGHGGFGWGRGGHGGGSGAHGGRS